MATVYVQRSQQGAIVGMFGARQPGLAEEAIDDRAAEAVAFRDRAEPAPRDLAAELDALKANVARAKAIEDAAVKKGVLTRAEVDAEVKPVSAEVVRG